MIDAHQHFWKISRGDYGWLTADLKELYQDFLPSNLAPLLSKTGIKKTILVQAAPTIEETYFLLELAEKTPFIAGIVGWVDMEADNGPEQIKDLASNPYLLGLRTMIQDIEDIDWMLSPILTKSFEAIIDNKLCFDALVFPKHLPNLLRLLKKHPELSVIIDHGAKPNIKENAFEEWSYALQPLAEETNAYCKISGLLTEAQKGAGQEDIAPYIEFLLEKFGEERLVWGSDWPVLNLVSDYESWYKMSRKILAKHSKKIMEENAANFYGIKENE